MLSADLRESEPVTTTAAPAVVLPAPTPTGTLLGYCRVSTSHQSLDQQLDALHAVGVAKVFTDTGSGARNDRPGLAELMTYTRSGDTVVVVALDRLGRSLSGIVRTVETLGERGVLLRSLREGVDTSTATGRMVLGSSPAWPSTSEHSSPSEPRPPGRPLDPAAVRWAGRQR